MNISRLATITLSLTLLAGCGGGGGGGGASPTSNLERLPAPLIQASQVAEVRELVGGMPPPPGAPSPSEIRTRVRDIAGNSNALLFSEIASGPGIDASRMITCSPGDTMCNVVIMDGMCAGEACMPRYPLDEVDEPILFAGGEGFEGFNDRYSIVMTTNTMIPIVQAQAAGRLEGVGRHEYQSYGGWMDNSVFVIERYTAPTREGMLSRIASYSFGSAAGTNPTGTGSATWNGVMIGVTSDSNHLVQGDAEVEIRDFSASPLVAFVEFTDIYNLETRARIQNMGWANLSLTDGGFSHTGNLTGYIKGTFYGMTHDEVGGIFDREGVIGSDRVRIIGAFGGVQ